MTRTTGNVALGGYFNDAFYLELLRTAHLVAVQAGVELTGGEVMGLGGRIRSYDAIAVPAESAELDAKANEFLAQFGLTREATISLLTNQLGVTQEELAYAWDIPTYTVMRGGKRQAPQAPEFFSANPLGDFDNQAWGTEVSESATVEGGDPGGGGAYRPNNTMMYRQGSNLAPKAEEIYGRGGDPRHAGVQMREQDEVYKLISPTGSENLAGLYPQGYGVNYEDDLFVPNTPLGWALEATVGAMFGPTGRSLMRAGGGRLFAMMARNLDTLPPELLVKFRQLSEIFDPKLADTRRADALAETAARDQRVAEVIETDAERRARLGISDDDVDEFRRSWEEDHPGDVRRPSEEMGGDSGAPLTRAESLVHALDSYEGMFSSPNDGTRLFQEFTEHPDRYGDTRPGWDPLNEPPETFHATERGEFPASELTDDELAEALHSNIEAGELAEHRGVGDQHEPANDIYHEIWRRFQPEDPIIDLAGAVSGGLSANAPRLDLNQITPSQLAEIPPDLLPMDVVPHPALPGRQDLLGQDGPYRFRPELEGDDRYQSLSPYDLSEEALDFLSITHVDGVPRPTTAQRLAHPPDYYPPSIHPGSRSSAYRPAQQSDLHSEIERIRRAEMQAAQDESWYQHQQALDPPDPLGEQVLPDTGARPGEHIDASGKPTGEWTFPDGMDRRQSMLDNWDPIEELKVWENASGHVNIRIGDTEFTLTSNSPGIVHITWGHIGYDIAPVGSMGRATTRIRDALRELGRIVEYLSANGVKLSASVDPGRAELVDAYRRMGFTITDPATDDAIVPFMPRLSKEEVAGNSPFGVGGGWSDEQLTYAMRQANQVRYREATGNYGMFRISLDPEAAFLEAALEGQSRMPLGLPFGGEEEWAGNAYALGKINQYSDEDIAHFYLLEAMEEYKPGEAAPFWENPPGFHPDGRPMNLQEMRNVPPNVLRDAYAKFRADRAATGFGHTGPGNMNRPPIPYADRKIIPAPGMEDTFAAFQRTVADAAPEVQDALARFVGAAEFRPRHDVGGDIRISDIMRVNNMDGHTRDIIVVELPDGTMQPFYKRSGGGNAPGDEAILAEGGGGGAHMWVPFDGFGQYGQDRHWFRKSRFMDGIETSDSLYRYGTTELKDIGDQIDQYMMMNEGSIGYANQVDELMGRPEEDIIGGTSADDNPIQVFEYTEVTPNDMRAGDEGFFAPAEANDLLGTVNMDDYSRMLAEQGEFRGPLAEWTEGLDPADFGRPLDEVSGMYNMDNPEYRVLSIRHIDQYEGGWNVGEAKPVGDRSDLTGIQYSQQDTVFFKNLLYEDRPDWARKYTIDEFEQMQRNGGLLDSEIDTPIGTPTEPFSPMTRMDPDSWSWPNKFGGGITGTAYGVAGLGAMNATDFLTPLLSRETTFEEALTGTAPAAQPVESMLAWQANNNEGWWSWIKDYPDHLEWMAKATAATMDALEKTSRSTNDQVLDGLGDGFREQAHGLATQMRGGAVPLVGREDPELLKGVGRDLSQRGHNGHQIFSNDTRKEIENGDAMIVGYRSDEDYQRAVGAAGRYGVVIDGNYWRRPSDNSLKPREGEEWTREHLQKMATSGYFGGAK